MDISVRCPAATDKSSMKSNIINGWAVKNAEGLNQCWALTRKQAIKNFMSKRKDAGFRGISVWTRLRKMGYAVVRVQIQVVNSQIDLTGPRFKEMREAMDITLDVARIRSGVNIGTISRWENGLNNILHHNFVKLAPVVNVQTSYVING